MRHINIPIIDLVIISISLSVSVTLHSMYSLSLLNKSGNRKMDASMGYHLISYSN